MPYVMVMGSLSAPHLSKDDGATVYGLKSEERAALVRELNSAFGMAIATSSDLERTVKVTQKGLTLVVVNRLHGLLGYDVVSHAMAMTNANRELVSFTLYKKSSPSSKGHSHGHGHGTSSHNTSSHSTSSHSTSSHSASSHSTPSHSSPSHTHGTSHKSHTQGNVITTL